MFKKLPTSGSLTATKSNNHNYYKSMLIFSLTSIGQIEEFYWVEAEKSKGKNRKGPLSSRPLGLIVVIGL